VLVVHSECQNVEALCEGLEEQGCRVTLARGAIEAFFQLKTVRPQAILLASEPTELGATEVCRAISQSTAFSNVPVFVCGANSDAEQEKMMAAGAAGYLDSAWCPTKTATILAGCVAEQNAGPTTALQA